VSRRPLPVAFRQALGQLGYFEGKNFTIEYRWAEGQYDRLPELAAELVRRQVAVIAAGGELSGLAAKAATSSIPIVFTIGGDPVEAGLVASFNRPGGNVTGVTYTFAALGPKRLEIVRHLAPNATAIAILINPNYGPSSIEARDVQTGARSLGLQIKVLNASTESEVDTAFSTIVQQRIDALIVGTDPFLLGQRDQLVRLAARHAVPSIYFTRKFVDAGGLGRVPINRVSESDVTPSALESLGTTDFAQRLKNLGAPDAFGLSKKKPLTLSYADR
jgi:putative tryptophan/tyrosine transport system substrate-binding protein